MSWTFFLFEYFIENHYIDHCDINIIELINHGKHDIV